jgi:hypothetical protein
MALESAEERDVLFDLTVDGMGCFEAEIRPVKGVKQKSANRRLPREAKNEMNLWLVVHMENPYMPEEVKLALMTKYNISTSQITKFLTNQRSRLLGRRRLEDGRIESNTSRAILVENPTSGFQWVVGPSAIRSSRPYIIHRPVDFLSAPD